MVDFREDENPDYDSQHNEYFRYTIAVGHIAGEFIQYTSHD
jgi:hypothetical protein